MVVGHRPFDVHGFREREEVALEAGPVSSTVAGGTEDARLKPANRVLGREEVVAHLGGAHNGMFGERKFHGGSSHIHPQRPMPNKQYRTGRIEKVEGAADG